MITSFDDYSIHQTHEPIAHPAQSDRNFYDRHWCNGIDMERGYIFEIGFGAYPNRYIMDAHFSVSIDGAQHSFHGSRRCPLDRADTTVGPLQVLVEEPMRKLRVRIGKNDTGIACDLLFTALTAPTEEPKNLLLAADIHAVMYNSRFTQFGRWEGWFEAAGKREKVAAQSCLGARDKSWGVRPVGEAPGGAPPTPDAPLPRVYWAWSPINFGDVCTQFGTFEEADGTPTQLSACMVPVYSNPEEVPQTSSEPGHRELRDIRHRVQWLPGTRRPAGASMEFEEADGTRHEITMEMAHWFYLRGIGYGHPDWTHAAWKGEDVIGGESWKMDEVDPLDPSFIHVHSAVRAKMGDRSGIGTLETIVLGPHHSGFKEFLDGA